MQNKIAYIVSGFVGILELLFCYGVSVNLFAFLKGIVGGYVLLFTGMTMSGTLILHALLEKYAEKDVVEKGIYVLSLTCIAWMNDWKLGCALLVLNVGVFLLQKHKWFINCVAIMSSILLVYAYRSSYVAASYFIFLLFTECLYCAKFNHKRSALINVSQCKFLRWKDICNVVVLKFVQGVCSVGVFWCCVISIMHIMQEGSLFRWHRVLFAMLLLGVCSVLLRILENRVSKNDIESVFGERIGLLVLIVILAVMLFRSSVVLACLMVVVGGSYFACEVLCAAQGVHMDRWVVFHVLVSVVLLCAELLYNGLSVDSSVVLWCAFVMEGLYMCLHSFASLDGIEE